LKGKMRTQKRSVIFDLLILITIIGVILYFSMEYILKTSLETVEENTMMSHLQTDLNYIYDLIADYSGAKDISEMQWSLNRNGNLFCNGTFIGAGEDAWKQGATNQNLLLVFEEHQKKTGTNAFIAVRTNNTDLSENVGHYFRSIGSTKDAEGNSIAGTYVTKDVADTIDKGSSFTGIAPVEDRTMYCIYEPIKNQEKEVIGYIVVGRDTDEVEKAAQKAIRQMRLTLGATIGLASVCLVVFLWFWARSIHRIKRYLEEIGTGVFPKEPLYLKRNDELGVIGESINDMTKSLKEKDRIGAELNVATNIQANMLPSIFPAFPEHDEFDIYATMSPAKEVGGDFYDYFMIDDSHVAMLVGDVSGKGVPAALFMVTAKTLIKDHSQMGLQPAEVFTRVNRILCEGNEAGLFVTGWMAVVDLKTGEMTYVNAGHNPPLLMHNGSFEYLVSKPGLVLAGLDTMKYRQASLILNPGDRLFLYTDGVTEATNLSKELYGEVRLKRFINGHKTENVQELLRNIRKEVDNFANGADQFDDITMLIFDYQSKAGGSMIEKIFAAEDASLESAMAFLEEEMEKAEVPMKASMQMSVALEELFVNVAHYAYPGRKGDVKMGVSIENNLITLSLKDSGIPFDPTGKEDPDITLKAEDRSIGGLGIFMVKKTMNTVDYEYKDGMNILTITKSF